MAWMVTIDNGSTFTDACLLADGALITVKVLTTPYDLMRCFADVFRALAREAGLPSEGELLRRVEEVRYSTTSGTNALLVRKGVRVGVIAGPEGTADLYGLRRTNTSLVDALVGDRVVGYVVGEGPARDVDDRILPAIRQLLARGAQWIVVSLPEPWGARAERDFKRSHMKLLPDICSGPCQCSTRARSAPTRTTRGAPRLRSSMASCTARWRGSCTTPKRGCGTVTSPSRCGSCATTALAAASPRRPPSRRLTRARWAAWRAPRLSLASPARPSSSRSTSGARAPTSA